MTPRELAMLKELDSVLVENRKLKQAVRDLADAVKMSHHIEEQVICGWVVKIKMILATLDKACELPTVKSVMEEDDSKKECDHDWIEVYTHDHLVEENPEVGKIKICKKCPSWEHVCTEKVDERDKEINHLKEPLKIPQGEWEGPDSSVNVNDEMKGE